jgi:hypothetical protein
MTKITEVEKKEMITNVYSELKNRVINPSGTFDKAGRFYLENDDLVSVRSPSRSYPYSQMTAGRTRKYVKAVCEKYDCQSEAELRNLV